MSTNGPYISETQVAESTPFDNSDTTLGFDNPDVQTALEELRQRTIYVSRTQASTLNGTLTLVRADDTLQVITGSATGYSIVLPNATMLTLGRHYKIDNVTTQTIANKDGSGTLLFNLSPSSIAELTLQANATAAGAWIWWQNLVSVANGVITYNVVSSTAFATTSTTDVLITGFTVTPAAGTYAVWVNGTWTPQAGPGNVETVSIYRAGTVITDSVRGISPVQSLNPALMCTQTITQVTGSQTIDVRVSSSSGQTLTVNSRSLLLIRLGA